MQLQRITHGNKLLSVQLLSLEAYKIRCTLFAEHHTAAGIFGNLSQNIKQVKTKIILLFRTKVKAIFRKICQNKQNISNMNRFATVIVIKCTQSYEIIILLLFDTYINVYFVLV